MSIANFVAKTLDVCNFPAVQDTRYLLVLLVLEISLNSVLCVLVFPLGMRSMLLFYWRGKLFHLSVNGWLLFSVRLGEALSSRTLEVFWLSWAIISCMVVLVTLVSKMISAVAYCAFKGRPVVILSAVWFFMTVFCTFFTKVGTWSIAWGAV